MSLNDPNDLNPKKGKRPAIAICRPGLAMKKTSKVYVLVALAGTSTVATSGRADAATPNCNSYANTVYIAGSSASEPLLEQLAVAIGSSVSIIYQSPSSCQGLRDVITNSPESTAAYYLDPTNPANHVDCDPRNGATTLGNYLDVGVSDVYPATCAAYSTVPQLATGQKDFHGPIQVMTMAVQVGSTEQSISAEAAYVAFGWAGQTNTVAPWTDPTMMFIRTSTSGTESMIGWAIGLPPSKWLAQSPFDRGTAQQESDSTAVVTALKAATKVNAAIGILSTEYVDQNRATLRALAFQAKDPHVNGDQLCGYLPDSDGAHYDKLNVRQGRYAIWGPLHFVANTDASGNPIANPMNTTSTNPAVARLIDFVSGTGLSSSSSDSQTLIQASQKAYTVPPCAMEVTSDSEIGALASYQPTRACGCYFESLAQAGMTTSPYCRSCSSDADCADAGIYKFCNYTYCEAR